MIRICHTADWHIRPTQRHDEYERVFQNLRASIIEKKIDIVFVAGDIYHNKLSAISPEYIRLLSVTLRSLGEICPVHLMLGNHDGIVGNVARLDAVSPIVEALADTNVVLHKKSIVHSLDDRTNLCIFSPFDVEGWENVRPESGKCNIAGFHGPVRGCKTDTGWELQSDRTIQDFDVFDFVLLGDIHKRQFLGDENPPRIGYPGSLCQQSYDEALSHGYLLWDIDTNTNERTVEYVEVQGATPFLTIDVDPSNFDRVMSEGRTLEDVRCKLVCSRLTPTQTSLLKESILSGGVKEVVVSESKDDVPLIIETESISDATSLLETVKDYATNVIRTSVPWESMEPVVRSYLDDADLSTNKASRWTLGSLEFDNMYSYGSGNRLDFSKFKGLVGINGENASGKSSILGVLLYALFNGSDRDCSKNAFYINDSTDEARATVNFEMEGSEYEIVRNTARNLEHRDAGVTKLSLRCKSNERDLTGEQRNDTDKKIRSLIGNIDDFMMTSMSVQEDMTRFIKEGSSARKDILVRFLGLEGLNLVHADMKKDLSSRKTERKTISVSSVFELRTRSDELASSISDLEVGISTKSEERDSMSDRIDELKVSLGSGTAESPDKLQREIEALESTESTLKSSITSRANALRNDEESLHGIEQQLKVLDAMDVVTKLQDALALKDSLSTSFKDQTVSDQRLETARKSVLKLADVPCGDQFPTCKYIVDAHQNKHAIASLEATALRCTEEVTKASERIKELNLDDLIRSGKQRNDLSRRISEMHRSIDSQKNNIQGILVQVENTAKSLGTLRQKLASVDPRTNDLLGELNSAIDARRVAQLDLDSMNVSLGKLRKSKEDIVSSIVKCERLDFETNILETIVDVFSKDGLPKHIMMKHLSRINSRMNSILGRMIDMSVDLRMEKNSLELFVTKAGRKRPAEMCSGMERTLIGLSLRAALRDVSTLPMPDFFIIDEGFSMLDSSNTAACPQIFSELKEIFRFVIVISHSSAMKEMMDSTIEVSMVDGLSKIDGSLS